MNGNQLKYALKELQFAAELPPAVLERLATWATLRYSPAGAVVFREGSENRNLYLVSYGRVALEMSVLGRGSMRILTLGPGQMVGWSALLGQGKMTASAVAVVDSELVEVPADQLRQLCSANHDVGYHVMRQMADALAKRLVATRLQLLDLFADMPPAIPDATPE